MSQPTPTPTSAPTSTPTPSDGTSDDSSDAVDSTPEETPDELEDTEQPPSRVGEERIVWETDVSYSASVTPVLGDSDYLLAGDSNGVVAQVATDDGSVTWSFDTELPIQDSPVLTTETVLVVEGRYREDFRLHGLDAAKGTQRWQFRPRNGQLTFLGTTDQTVFVATSDEEERTSGETLYALSLADGEQMWSREIGDASGGLVTDDRVYVPAVDTVTALGTDGSRQWTYEGSDHLSGALAATDETVVVVMSPERRQPVVHGIDATTGERRWTFDDWRAFSLRTDGGRLFVGGEKLARLDPTTGKSQWEKNLEVAQLAPGSGDNRWIDDWRQALSGAPVTEGTLYVGGSSAAAVNVEDGTVRWKTDHEQAMVRPAGIGGDRLVFHASASSDDRDRHLFALDVETGNQHWEFAGRFRLTAPAVGTDRVYAAESRSGLLALEL